MKIFEFRSTLKRDKRDSLCWSLRWKWWDSGVGEREGGDAGTTMEERPGVGEVGWKTMVLQNKQQQGV